MTLLSDCFFYQQSSHKYPQSSTPREDTERMNQDKSNLEKRKYKWIKIKLRKQIEIQSRFSKIKDAMMKLYTIIILKS